MKNSALDISSIPFIDITKYNKWAEDGKPKDKKRLDCVWSLDDIHTNDVKVIALFDGRIEVPICGRHLSWHRAILANHYSGIDIEDILVMSKEECISLMISFGLVGVRI